MLKISKYLAAFVAILLLTTCGTISQIHTFGNIEEPAKINFSKFDKIILLDLINETNSPLFYDMEHIPITQLIPDKIYYSLKEKGFFDDKKIIKTKSQKFIQKGNLIISGYLTKYDDGNDVLRGIFGIFGRTRLEGKINLVDGETKEVIAQIDVKKSSLAYGLFISANQNLQYVTQVSADEIAAKINDLKRKFDGKI